MKELKTFEELKEKVISYLPESDCVLLKKAYEFAEKCHQGQTRSSGEPYIHHPLAVAYILAELHQDSATLCAGLLHDTLEDCDITAETLIQEFGDDVYQLVDGVTKLGRIYFESHEEAQAENFRKMFIAMAKDIRVIIIKLADRLHNMRTLKFLSKEKQHQIAKETRDIFSPLAHRLGIWSIKWELEDLTFYYLQYNEFQDIKRLVASKREEREGLIHEFMDELKKKLHENHLQAKVQGRPKHFFSIYKKLASQNISFDELYDMLGIRVIVSNIRECYEVLGLVHSMYKPINGRFKDYIAMPKTNLYQSLHTTVIGPKGNPIEVQIRTSEMDQIADYGVAAHWRYKEGGGKRSFDADFAWLRQILETQQEKTAAKEFLTNLKVDLFIDEVFVFTPKGDVQVLPKGATPIDFAYRIHTEIGHSYAGAKVNGHIVNLKYTLQSGDRIEILANKKPQPKLEWLQVVQTAQAKTKIKQWFKRQNVHETIQKAKTKLDKVFLVAGYLPKDVFTKDSIELLSEHFDVENLEDLYLEIIQGDFSVQDVFQFLEPKLKDTSEEEAPLAKMSKSIPKGTQQGELRILGEDNVMASLAKCCKPLPGDSIIGYITFGFGVSVHRTDCLNVTKLDDTHKARLVQAEWNTAPSNKVYPAVILVEAFDRIGILKDILNTISDTKTNVIEVKTKTLAKGGRMKATITVEIHDLAHLNKVKQAILGIQDVFAFSRSKHK